MGLWGTQYTGEYDGTRRLGGEEGNEMAEEMDILGCQESVYDEQHIEVFLRVSSESAASVAKSLGANCYQIVNDDFTIFFVKVPPGKDCVASTGANYYAQISFLWGFDIENASAQYSLSSGLIDARKEKNFNLTGEKVLIGVIGTGINYLHETFIYEDNTSKILSIWDQSVKAKSEKEIPKGFFYGTEYSNDQINQAIKSDKPYEVVPSKDDNGHTTFIAGVAAGRASKNQRFLGMAPDSELIIVKLKQARKCVTDYYHITEGTAAFQSSDIIMGVQYLVEKAHELGRPLVILYTAETNQGGHDGSNYSSIICEQFGYLPGIVFVASGGDEASSLHHYHGQMEESAPAQVEFNVATGEGGLTLFIWSYAPDEFDIQLITPTGTATERIKAGYNKIQNISLALEESKLDVLSTSADIRTGDQTTFITFDKPVPGIWTLKLYGTVVVNKGFHIWMPIRNFVKPNTIFLQPDPYVTLVPPSTAMRTVSVCAYDSIKNSIYVQSGRGYNRLGEIKPDLVAPGVNILGPGLQKNDYVVKSGSGVAAAAVAGAVAKILQWGIVEKNDVTLNTISIRTILLRGANRNRNITYPNREWGYGVLNTMNSLMKLGNR